MNNFIPAKKSLGQNFLHDETILNKIANSCNTSPSDLIIEIGPGKGALTKYLIKKDSYLICYEIDERMQPILNSLINNKTRIIYKDFLKTDIENDIKDIKHENIYIIANIPYYITTPIIKHVINLPRLKSMTLLVQKEVAERFSALPNSKAYGSLTVYLNYYFDINYLFDVKNTSFTPAPKVDSAVINFTKKEIKYDLKDENLFFKLVEDAFKMKRKTLKNNLKEYNWSKIEKVLITHNLPTSIRAEQVSLELFIEIANILKEK
ncbi:MAG: 16S rRNA (adenine(1518)-N(6)/adenine(1519)-N(6))-dimethyltransferase RsmA [Bacilli bacterium]|nr:16S rRNA (adenine(1518)-N(6)/adenine(1519)-N(6))-dimethyltransferase RsmA [Bacilli bacterium]